MGISNWTRKIVGFGAINFKEGKVLFNKIPMIIYPTYAIALLNKLLEKEENGIDVLYWQGHYQGKRCAQTLIGHFGYKKNILDTLSQHSDMVGLGKWKVLRADLNNLHFVIKCEVSSIAEETIKYYGLQKTAIDHYLRGVWVGFLIAKFNIKKELLCIETRCKAKGDQYCELVIKEKSSWNLKDPMVKKQIPKKITALKKLEEKGEVFLLDN